MPQKVIRHLLKHRRIPGRIILPVHLFQFLGNKIRGSKQKVKKVRFRMLQLVHIFPVVRKQIFQLMGQGRKTVNVHHSGGALDGMHDPENTVNTAFVKSARSLSL